MCLQLTSQHPYAEVYIGQPHVWTVDIENSAEVERAIRSILSQKVNTERFSSVYFYQVQSVRKVLKMVSNAAILVLTSYLISSFIHTIHKMFLLHFKRTHNNNAKQGCNSQLSIIVLPIIKTKKGSKCSHLRSKNKRFYSSFLLEK